MLKRILFKISGEALLTDIKKIEQYDSLKYLEDDPRLKVILALGFVNGIMLLKIAEELGTLQKRGKELIVVTGGGNICRGEQLSRSELFRVEIDQMGMLATVMNGFCLKSALKSLGIPVAMLSTQTLPSLCELYTVEAAQKYLNQGAVLLCVGGTGLPYFSTDTSAVIRACELRCDALFKGTKVRGIFEQDPVLQPQADFISVITHQEFLNKKLKVMDETAVSIAMKNNLTLRLFCLYEDQALVRVCDGTLNHSVIRTEQ